MGLHTSEWRWDSDVVNQGDTGVHRLVSGLAGSVKSGLITGEDSYQELLELHAFAGGTTQLLADQLFLEVWSTREPDPVGAPGVFDTQANAEEVAKTQDSIDAMLAIHEVYEALTNVAVSQSDRMAPLRRMS